MTNTTATNRRFVRLTVLPLGVVLATAMLAGCSPRGGGRESDAYVPATGSSSGAVVPNARPGMQSAPAGASTAGSSIGRL